MTTKKDEMKKTIFWVVVGVINSIFAYIVSGKICDKACEHVEKYYDLDE